MDFTNKRIQKVKPSETLAVKSRAAELKAEGKSIIDLSAGEPDIDTPQHIKDAAAKALLAGQTKYTNVTGIVELRQAISEKLQKENGISADANSIVVTNGGKQAIYSFFDVTLEKGDEVVILAPYWVSYPPMVELCGGVPVVINAKLENGLKVTPQELKQHLNSKTKCVVINSPSNPTGVGYSEDELKDLGAVIQDYPNCIVLSDEVYEKLIYGDFKFVSFAKAVPQLANRVVTVNAFSKTYSMTGWRVGYVHGPKEIIGAIGRHQSQTTSNVCAPAQYGALAALKGSHDFIGQMLINFQKRIDMSLEILESVPGLSVGYKPNGAFYLFVNFAAYMDKNPQQKLKGSGDFANFLLEKAGVAVVPGEAFGDDRAFRMSVSSSDENVREGLSRIAKALGQR